MSDLACYQATLDRPENAAGIDEIRAHLHQGAPLVIGFMPGDGTAYRFLLVPCPVHEAHIGNGGRNGDVELRTSPSPGALLVTVMDGLGNGTTSILPTNTVDSVRFRLTEKLEIRNTCTVEALASLVARVWCD